MDYWIYFNYKKRVVRLNIYLFFYTIYMIVFCFLTYNDIIPLNYWNNFFKNIDKSKYQVWIHPKNDVVKEKYDFEINIVQNKINTISKSHISIVEATLQLFKESYSNNGDFYIFCSQNCIPLYNFEFFENFTKNLNKSIISCIHFNRKDRYNSLNHELKKIITYNQFVKQQPNMILTKKDVKLLIDNNFIYYFKNIQCPDEHYFINVFLFFLKINIIKSQSHFCNYDLNKTQALVFNPTPKLINFIKDKGFLFMRKVY